MEKKLQALFGFQRFEKNPRLERIIEESEARFSRHLSEEDLQIVAAAGELSKEEIAPGSN